jgi:hypothetical protein
MTAGRILALVGGGLCWWTLAAAQPLEFFPLSSVKPGLHGVGKTVFHGATVEDFHVEILGVLEKVGPQQSIILARLSGEQVDQYGVFAGMSGSPVYIDGKLVGAVAYAFTFATAPIAGITPIQEMVDVFKEHPGIPIRLTRRSTPASLYDIDSLRQVPDGWRTAELDPGLAFPSMHGMGRLQPIQMPLNLSGFSRSALGPFSGTLNALNFMPAFGGAAAAGDEWRNAPLVPGSTVAVQLVRGDMEVSASGTVTHINGDRIYAFGHPFLSVGYTDLPLAKAAVLGVVPTLMVSQKLSATLEPVGAIRQDRSTGILGMKGETPRMIPVNLRLATSRGESRDFRYEVVTDSFLTPFLVAFTVQNSIVSSERSIGGQTLRLKCRIALKGFPEVTFENSVSNLLSSSAIAGVAAAAPVDFLLASGFDDIVMERIDVEIAAFESTREAVLDKVWQDVAEARPGEEVGITVFLRKPNGDVTSEKYPVRIPDGMTPGPLKIMVGDGITITRQDARTETAEFIPRNVGQLVRAINNLKKNDRLYIRLFREQQGAVIGGQGLPGLPPSLLALYDSKKTSGDVQPIKQVVFVEHELPATEFVITGQRVIEINIKG